MSKTLVPAFDASSSRLRNGRWDFGFETLFSRASQRIALIVVIGSFFMPMTGLGVDLCWFHWMTGLPCPGCGLTRAFAAMSHGDLRRALALHPFVVLIYPLFVGIAVVALLPQRLRHRLFSMLEGVRAPMQNAYRLALSGFVVFGVVRLAGYIIAGEHFP